MMFFLGRQYYYDESNSNSIQNATILNVVLQLLLLHVEGVCTRGYVPSVFAIGSRKIKKKDECGVGGW